MTEYECTECGCSPWMSSMGDRIERLDNGCDMDGRTCNYVEVKRYECRCCGDPCYPITEECGTCMHHGLR